MDQGPPESKRPRLSTDPWLAGGSQQGVSLLHPQAAPSHSPTSSQVPPGHHPAPPPVSQYQQPSPSHPHPFSRPPGDHQHPPPYPLQHPLSHQQQPPPPQPPQHPSHHLHITPPQPPGQGAPPGPLPPSSAAPQPPPPLPPGPGQPSLEDRRHHEPERYPSMQDPRHPLPPPPQQQQQPPLSPAQHPPYSPYPIREPMIKPDPGDEGLPHLRRPLSTGAPPEQGGSMAPGTPHSGLGLGPQPFGGGGEDSKRHLSFDGGGPPPHMYRQQSYPPPTPIAQNSPYEYPPHGYPPPGDMGFPIQIAGSGKRKAQRASQACDNCRALKAKCDEMKPCKSCKEKKIECKYREAAPKQQDKVAADILDNIMFLRSEFAAFAGRLTAVERELKRRNTDSHTDPGHETDERPESASAAAGGPMSDEPDSLSPGEPNGTHAQHAPEMSTLEAQKVARAMDNEANEAEVPPGPYVRPGNPTIPLNHTTLAAFLLKWRSIERLVKPYLESEKIRYVDEFPMRQEERRGILRVWGRGEGLDGGRFDRDGVHDQGTMEVRDDYSESGAPSPADCWGGIGSSPGPLVDTKVPVVPVSSTPGIDFSESSVWKYVRSYEDNIQNMHPLIIPTDLHAMVKLFLDEIQQNQARQLKSAIAKFVAPVSEGGGVPGGGVKRKRTSPAPDGPDGSGLPTPKPAPIARPSFQRTVNNAVVLLVLALGKICLCQRIPDVVPVSDPPQTLQQPHGSPVVRNGHPASPIQGSPPSLSSSHHHTPHSTSNPSNLPSPQERGGGDGGSSSRRASFQGGGPGAAAARVVGTSHKRNLDVIPGLDYFAYATDILGGQLAGASLRHVYAHILAGLYHGQLGRVMESYTHIRQAGLSLYTKMRGKLGHFSSLQHSARIDPKKSGKVGDKTDNQLIVAFWTILQLESDIVAELPMPQSHVLQYEDAMPYPSAEFAIAQGFETRVLQSYLAQLYMRKRLNEIHRTLYNPDNQKQPYDLPNAAVIQEIEDLLNHDVIFPSEFRFAYDAPPASDILSARLRAKHWGAQVITYRPFIRYILESNFLSERAGEPPIPADGEGVGSPSQEYSMLSVIQYAQKGIRALIESTRAFHGLGETRPIITNVFGTAHAQWGNLLTLAAIVKDPTLGNHVDQDLLHSLFAKTIAFFRNTAQPSSPLSIDMRIMEHLERVLWGGPGPASANSSFSSSNPSTGPPGPTKLPPVSTGAGSGPPPNMAVVGSPLGPPPVPVSVGMSPATLGPATPDVQMMMG